MSKRMIVIVSAILLSICAVTILAEGSDAEPEEAARIGNKYYSSLDDAISSSISGDVIVVMNGSVLHNDATIPKGVTLLIPYTDSHGEVNEKGYENGPDPTKTSGAYRKRAGDNYCVTQMTIPDGVTLTVNGSVIIGGIIAEKFTFDYQGHTWGDHGKIVLNGSIIMESGSQMKCYGYVKGSGQIMSKNGSEVFQPFIITDFVGGDVAREMYDHDQSPFNRYTFSNIQTELTVNYGSRLIGMATIYVQGMLIESNINVVGISSPTVKSLLELNYGSKVTMRYDAKRCINVSSDEYWKSNIWKDVGTTDIDLYGGATFNIISLSYGGYTMDTSNLEFSIPYNYRYTLNDGIYVMEAGLRLLPGSSIMVSDTSTLVVNKNLYVFNGLVDYGIKEVYYPGPELLAQYGFSSHGSLFVNGELIISQDATVVGVLESDSDTGRVIIDPNVAGYKNWYVNFSTGNYTVRSLSTWAYTDGGELEIPKPGNEYSFGVGTNVSDSFEYIYKGETTKKECEQTYQGVRTGVTPESGSVNVYLKLDGEDVNDALVTVGNHILAHDGERYTSTAVPDGKYSVDVKIGSYPYVHDSITVSKGTATDRIYLFTVSFESDGEDVQKMIVPYDSLIELPSITKKGYYLEGWYDDSGCRFTNDISVRSSIDLTASWVESNYLVINMDESMRVNLDKNDLGTGYQGFLINCPEDVRIILDKKNIASLPDVFTVLLDISKDVFTIKVGVDNPSILKTISLPYDIMRSGAKVKSTDGSEITDEEVNAGTKQITFVSSGSSFTIEYDPEPSPIDIDGIKEKIMIAVAILIVVILIVVALLVIHRKHRSAE